MEHPVFINATPYNKHYMFVDNHVNLKLLNATLVKFLEIKKKPLIFASQINVLITILNEEK